MANSYGKVYSPYEDLPSDVEPSSDHDRLGDVNGLSDDHWHVDRKPVGVYEIGTDISSITDVDSRIDESNDDSVYAGLHEKLNLVINSHRIIIDRLDTLTNDNKMIMARLEQNLDANDD
jgi:hypothetical protein